MAEDPNTTGDPTDGTRRSATSGHAMSAWVARALVFGSSAAVLVLEIVAGRLMAPYVGISLETFTGIIGTVLAGIALGAWAGGELADRTDPGPLIGVALAAGGALSWLSLPIVSTVGPQLSNDPLSIVLLTGVAFFLPAAVLSAVSPMVAKLRLRSLEDTGSVVGGLSAAGTIGALAGTFITGFVLVSALPSKPIVIVIGAVLVASGAATHWGLARTAPAAPVALVLLACLGLGVASDSPCQHETGYFCVVVEQSATNPNGRNLILDRLRHAYVNLEDPTDLDIRYIRLFAQVAEARPGGPISSLHIGGGGFSFPRYLQTVRPGSDDLVLEIDSELVKIAENELGLVQTDALQVQTGDARLALDDLATNQYDLVVGDAFSGASVPWHLTTREFLSKVERVMRPNGLYVMNVIDGGDYKFARAELATLQQVFNHVAVIQPTGGLPEQRSVNVILVASNEPIPQLAIAPADGRVLTADEAATFIDNASPLRDDFAPVDQLLFG